MGYALRDHVSYCDVAGRLVFLDVAADRYFCLAEKLERDFRAITNPARDGSDDDESARALLGSGLLAGISEETTIAPCVPPPTPLDSLLDDPAPTTFRATGRAMTAVAASLLRVRYRPFAANLAAAARQPEYTGDTAALDRIAASFAKASSWLSVGDRCLAQSLAVARATRRAGLSVDLVFGVSLGPFEAHCWVQSGRTVVNDRVEIVNRFVPILVH